MLFFIGSFAQKKTNVDATAYKIKGRLTTEGPSTPACGVVAWSIIQKFEVLSTNFPNYKNRYVLVIQSCPEFLGKGFFKKNKIYEMEVTKKNDAVPNFVITNNYDITKIPTFNSKKINKID